MRLILNLKCFFWHLRIDSSLFASGTLAQISVSSNVTKVVNPTKSFPILFISPAKLSMAKISTSAAKIEKNIVFSQFNTVSLDTIVWFCRKSFSFPFFELEKSLPEACSWCFGNPENDWTFQSEFHRMLVSSKNIFQRWKCCSHASYFSSRIFANILRLLEKRK